MFVIVHYNNNRLPNLLFPMSNKAQSHNLHRFLAWFLLSAMINLIHSCYYYKVTKPTDPPPESIIRLQNENNFIILNRQDTAWHFTEIIADNDTIRGKLSVLEGHDKYKTTKDG